VACPREVHLPRQAAINPPQEWFSVVCSSNISSSRSSRSSSSSSKLCSLLLVLWLLLDWFIVESQYSNASCKCSTHNCNYMGKLAGVTVHVHASWQILRFLGWLQHIRMFLHCLMACSPRYCSPAAASGVQRKCGIAGSKGGLCGRTSNELG
jgi:hypothetical protein